MKTLWSGRFKEKLDERVNEFNSSIKVDLKMYRADIIGSIAHATMLYESGIITEEDGKKIIKGLEGILSDLDAGELDIDYSAEDIHMFIEAELTSRIGDVGKRLHTARSRNDQVAVDLKIYLREEIDEIDKLISNLIKEIVNIAQENTTTIMPGYTHLQRAQPISFAQHILAYAFMLLRDKSRLFDCSKRMNQSPLGACALAGTTYPINREYTAKLLMFDSPTDNSIDSVSDRDFAIELASCLSIIMTHLSRFSEEIILWCSWEFKFVELSDSFSTGSSIMPQKKNPDIPELIRGKTGRVNGALISLLTMMKGLPLAYNKDMQEDKELLFDSIKTVKDCLSIFTPMLETMSIYPNNMRMAAAKGFINATDVADYLVKKGLPFRTAYKVVGELVAYCIDNNKILESLSIEEYKKYCDLFDIDVYQNIDLLVCMQKRTSLGGTGSESVQVQIDKINSLINL